MAKVTQQASGLKTVPSDILEAQGSSVNTTGGLNTHTDTIHQQFSTLGFAAFDRDSLSIPSQLNASLEAILKMGRPNALPHDPYDQTSRRRRMLGTCLLNRVTGELIMTQPQDRDGKEMELYYQASSFNAESGNIHRYFPALSSELRENASLHWMIRRLYAAIPEGTLQESLWVSVGIHLVQLQPEPGETAQVTPNAIHRDGEAVTYIILLHREGVSGGVNYVTTPHWTNHQPEDVPPADVLAETTLVNPLSGLGVIDEQVAHHVSPVQNVTNSRACRTVMLIDYSELIPYRA